MEVKSYWFGDIFYHKIQMNCSINYSLEDINTIICGYSLRIFFSLAICRERLITSTIRVK